MRIRTRLLVIATGAGLQAQPPGNPVVTITGHLAMANGSLPTGSTLSRSALAGGFRVALETPHQTRSLRRVTVSSSRESRPAATARVRFSQSSLSAAGS